MAEIEVGLEAAYEAGLKVCEGGWRIKRREEQSSASSPPEAAGQFPESNIVKTFFKVE